MCPDFGSTLGPGPSNIRTDILASRSIGLFERRSIFENRFLKGIESDRTFGTSEEMLCKSRQLILSSDEELILQSKTIRKNYLNYHKESTADYQNFVNKFLEKVVMSD